MKWGSNGAGNGQFAYPQALAINISGCVYVADTNNNRIQVFTRSGTYLFKWGSFGTGNGQFNGPGDIAINGSGYVYVADWQNARIQIFKSNGVFIRSFGSEGSGNGQFGVFLWLAINSSGYVYVTDLYNTRIQVFTAWGTYVRQWGSSGAGNGQFSSNEGITVNSTGFIYVADSGNDRIQVFNAWGTYIAKWGSSGTGNSQFQSVGDVVTSTLGYVYTIDDSTSRIQVFTANGQYLAQWGSFGSGDGQFNNPWGLTLNSSDYVYVADRANSRVQVFSSTPYYAVSYTNSLAFSTLKYLAINATLRFSANVVNTQFLVYSYGISNWNLITQSNVLNNYQLNPNTYYNGSLFQLWFRFNKSTSFTVKVIYNITLYYYNPPPPMTSAFQGRSETLSSQINLTPTLLKTFGLNGAGNGQFNSPKGIAINGSGFVYIADFGNNRIQVFTKNGVYVRQWGSAGAGNGQFNGPCGIAINSTGFIYVTDELNHRVQVFNAWGTYIMKWGSNGAGNGQFQRPGGIAINSTGFVYVTEVLNQRVQIFTKNGVYKAQFALPSLGVYVNPSWIAINSTGYIYITHASGVYGAYLYTRSGSLIKSWTNPNPPGSFGGVAINGSDVIYLTVYISNPGVIQLYTKGGTFISKWNMDGQSYNLAINSTNFVYVVDQLNSRIVIFSPFNYYINRTNSFTFSALKPTFVGALLNFNSFGSNVTLSLYNYATLSWDSLTSNKRLMNYQLSLNYYNGSHFLLRFRSLQQQSSSFIVRSVYNITLFYYNVPLPSMISWTKPTFPNHTSQVDIYVNVSGNFQLDKVLLKWSANNWVTNSTWQSLLNITTSLPTLTKPTTWKTLIQIPTQADKTTVRYVVRANYTIGVPVTQYFSYIVLDYVPPYFIHNPNTNIKPTNHPGATMNFLNISCLVYDAYPGVSKVRLQENITLGGSIKNWTMIREPPSKYFYYLSISALSSSGWLKYRFWANDTHNNANWTQWYYIRRDIIAPTIISWTVPSNPQYNNTVLILATITDLYGINTTSIILNWTVGTWPHTGVNQTRTLINIGGNTWQISISLPTQPYPKIVRWVIRARDLGGNTATVYFSYQVQDIYSPTITSVSFKTPVTTNTPVWVNVTIVEPSGASGVKSDEVFLRYWVQSEGSGYHDVQLFLHPTVPNLYGNEIPGMPFNESVAFVILVKDNASNSYTSGYYYYTVTEVIVLVNWTNFTFWVIVVLGATLGVFAFLRKSIPKKYYYVLGIVMLAGITALLWLVFPWWEFQGLDYKQYLELLSSTGQWPVIVGIGVALFVGMVGIWYLNPYRPHTPKAGTIVYIS
jgi:hypothetical protein